MLYFYRNSWNYTMFKLIFLNFIITKLNKDLIINRKLILLKFLNSYRVQNIQNPYKSWFDLHNFNKYWALNFQLLLLVFKFFIFHLQKPKKLIIFIVIKLLPKFLNFCHLRTHSWVYFFCAKTLTSKFSCIQNQQTRMVLNLLILYLHKPSMLLYFKWNSWI